ncbi:MAG: transporter substrate-binding domain-containing protein [Bacteroidaceae bacterium]|nr:transporter substrate-binding domain-containing protein [Bacteroidaceae bacterium]
MKNILRGAFCIFSILVALCVSASSDHPVKITPNLKKIFLIKGDRAYPPFEFINRRGQPDGFNVELLKAVMEEQGLQYKLELDDWNKVVEGLKTKQIDAAIGMVYSPDRASFAKFGMPHNFIFQNIVYRKGGNIDSLEQLRGKQIIVQDRAQAHELLLKTKLSNKIVKVASVEEGLVRLSQGEGDALICNNFIASYYIHKDGIHNLEMTAIHMEPLRYSMVVNMDNDELLKQLNMGLHKLKLNGAYDRIYDKWFGVYEKADYEQVLLFLSLLLIVVTVLFGFLMVLRRQVRRATRKLKNSYREIELAIDGGGLAIWMYNITKDRFSSLHGRNLFWEGCSFDEYKKIFHPDDIPTLEHNLLDLKNAKVEKTFEVFRCIHQNSNQILYIEQTIIAVKEEGVITHLIGTHKDVTLCSQTKKRLEDSLIKTDFALKASQMMQWDYVVETQTLHSRYDGDFFNRSFPMRLEEFWPMVHPEDLEAIRSLSNKMNARVDEMQSVEFRVKAALSSSYLWITLNVAPFQRDEKGRIISYTGLSRDNSRWHTMMDDLNLLREKAEESNRLKSTFLANMSHEIRTPLNAIVGFSSLISSAETEEECKLFEENINCNAEILLNLVSDILDISKIESGNMRFHYAPFDLCEMCKSVYYQFSLRMKEEVELRYSPIIENLLVDSDMSRLMQVLTNFVGNAVKFTDKGFIEIGFTALETQVEVWVKDSGSGIPADKLEQVFHRFSKLNDFVQGTGLGLSISQNIVQHLGGTIGVESKLGVGSRFWFRIPFTPSNLNEHIESELFS